MLYLDSSALIRHYVQEPGTQSLNAKLESEEKAGRPLFTSVLTFAEIHRALAARMKDKSLSRSAFAMARKEFEADWLSAVTSIELKANVLALIPDLVERFALKSSDVIHLASALWMRDTLRVSGRQGPRVPNVTFATSDLALVKAAQESNLGIFNPQTQSFP